MESFTNDQACRLVNLTCTKPGSGTHSDGDLEGQAAGLDSLGYAHRKLGHHRRATEVYRQAIALYERLGDQYNRAWSHRRLGDAHQAAGGGTRSFAVWTWLAGTFLIRSYTPPSQNETPLTTCWIRYIVYQHERPPSTETEESVMVPGRPVVVAAAALLASAVIAACGGGGEPGGQPPGEIKVGVSAALTGSYADVGKWFLRGVELAAKRYRSEHFDRLTVVSQDNKGDPTQAAVVFNKLVDVEKVPVVFGGFTNLSEPVVPIANRSRTVYVNPLAPADSLGGKPYVFNTLPLAAQEMDVLARWLHGTGYRRLAMLTSSQHDGVSAGETVSEKFRGLGGEVVEWQQHQAEQTDFSAGIAKIAAANPDVIMIHTPFRDFARAVPAVRAAGLDQPIVGYRGVESPDLVQMCGQACEGVVYTVPFYDASSAEAKAVADAYRAEYGEEASFYFGVMYDAAWAVFSAMDKAFAGGATRIDGETLDKALVGTPFDTPFTGTTELTDGGVPKGKPFFVKVIENGKFEIRETFES